MCECLNPCGRRIDTDTTKGLHVQLISAHRHQTKPVIRINSGRTPLALLATHLLPSFLPSRLARLTATHVTRNIPPKRWESSFFFFPFQPPDILVTENEQSKSYRQRMSTTSPFLCHFPKDFDHDGWIFRRIFIALSRNMPLLQYTLKL